jgi:hypothetical protein
MSRALQHRLRIAAVVLLLALTATLLFARPARAGSYVVTECSSVSAWAPDATWERSSEHYLARARCGTDDGLQAYHDAEGSDLGDYGAWLWRAPAGTVFTAVQANASLTYQAGHRGQLIATTPSGEAVELGEEHGDFRVHGAAAEFTSFESRLGCVAAPQCGRAGGDGAHAYVRGVYLRVEDRAAPTVSVTGGSLLGDPVVRGTRELAFSATDEGGGIRRIWVEAGGSPLVSDDRNCALAAGFATALRPCPAATAEAASVPTASAAFATGPGTVSACAEDLGLDATPNRTCEQLSIWVDNACPSSAVAGGAALSAGFDAGGDAATVRSDRRAVIRGRLTGAGAGATVCALTRDGLAEAPVVVAATATTDADGGYAIELPPGPSREVFVHYAVGDSVLARHGLSVRAIVRPALEVRPRAGLRSRDRLRFTGALPGPACAQRLVKVQAQLGHHRWQVFRTARSGPGCRFHALYRLRSTRHARRYRFRTLVPQQAGYPYEAGRSRVVRVKVSRRR